MPGQHTCGKYPQFNKDPPPKVKSQPIFIQSAKAWTPVCHHGPCPGAWEDTWPIQSMHWRVSRYDSSQPFQGPHEGTHVRLDQKAQKARELIQLSESILLAFQDSPGSCGYPCSSCSPYKVKPLTSDAGMGIFPGHAASIPLTL